MDKHSSLLLIFVNYVRKKFYYIEPWRELIYEILYYRQKKYNKPCFETDYLGENVKMLQ